MPSSPPSPPIEFSELIDLGSQDHYLDADLYDHEYSRRRKDTRFYTELARSLAPKRTLEMCCGSGRVTRALAKAGIELDAFDLSQPMLNKAERRLIHAGKAAFARVQLSRGDMRTFEAPAPYNYILCAFNSLEHLYTRTELQACLARVTASLAPGGTFAFDVQNPHLEWLCRDPERRWSRTLFRHPKTRQRLEYSTNHDYDPVSQIVCIRLFYRPVEKGPLKKEKVVHLSQRKYFPAELEALLHYGGFRVVDHLGDFAGEPLHEDAENQVLVCEART